MTHKIVTKKIKQIPQLGDYLQVGYYLGAHWCPICNLKRSQSGYITDRYPGWKGTITEWKKTISGIFNKNG
jgi:hypothetical protein